MQIRGGRSHYSNYKFLSEMPYLSAGYYRPACNLKISDFKTEELTFYTKVNSTVGVPVNLYAETVYTITVQDDRFLPILEDTVFHADVDYLILLDLI